MYVPVSVEYEVLLTLAVHSEILATLLDESWTFSVGLKYKILSMVGLAKVIFCTKVVQYMLVYKSLESSLLVAFRNT